ncbi:MAG: hypothetical protein AAFU78_14570 [Cyanobacteria bacterium J06633_2]
MLKFVPYSTQPKTQAVPVGTVQAGILWFEKRGHLTVRESPLNLQAQEKRQARVNDLIFIASEKLASDQGISKRKARELLLNKPVKKESDNSAETDDDSGVEANSKPVGDEPQNKVEAEVDYTIIDFLTADERRDFLQLTSAPSTLELDIATLMMQYRVLFPVTLASNVQVKSKQLEVMPLKFPIEAGDRLKFDQLVVEVTELAVEGSGLIAVNELPAQLNAESVGFLCQRGNVKCQTGIDGWTREDTESHLGYKGPGQSMIDSIVEFYRLESTDQKVAPEGDGPEEGELSPPSGGTSTPRQLTGEKSSSDSNISDAETSD